QTYLDPVYENIDISPNGIIVAKKDGVIGLIDQDKAFLPVDGAERIWPFLDGAPLTYARKGGQMGFIDAQGKWVIEPQYERARAFRNGLAPVYMDGKWGYVDTQGNMVIEPQYRDAEIFGTDGLAPVKINKLWGLIDSSGTLVIPDDYDISVAFMGFLESGDEKGFIDGLARVKYKKDCGFIDTQGNVLGGTWYRQAELFSK